jgi:hypothetical protein
MPEPTITKSNESIADHPGVGGLFCSSPFPANVSVPEMQAPAQSEFFPDKYSFKSGGPEVVQLMKQS